jgi:DNA uptake protein ComE-like DNA-binding protein
MLGVSLLLLLSLLLRIAVQFLPGREPPGVEEFEREAKAMMAAFAKADSMEQLRGDSLNRLRSERSNLTSSFASTESSAEQYRPVDINRADSVLLLPLPGIGPVFAGRIIKYRNLLGGFVSVEQLSEVYGMPSETVDLIRNKVFIDCTAVQRIRIDSASFGELLRHPYLEYEEVRALVEYRDFKKDISSPQELNANQILHDSTLNKIEGYFDYK